MGRVGQGKKTIKGMLPRWKSLWKTEAHLLWGSSVEPHRMCLRIVSLKVEEAGAFIH